MGLDTPGRTRRRTVLRIYVGVCAVLLSAATAAVLSACSSSAPVNGGAASTGSSEASQRVPANRVTATPVTSPTRAASISHTHFRAVWKTVDVTKPGIMTIVRDLDNYAETGTGPSPFAMRARGARVQLCDTSQCKIVSARDAQQTLRSVYVDPTRAVATMSLDSPVPGATWHGHPSVCVSGRDYLGISPTARRTVCYLRDVNLLYSMKTTGSAADYGTSTLTSLTGEVSSTDFNDLRAPLPR